MQIKKNILLVVLILCTFTVFSQQQEPSKTSHFSFTIGSGWNHFIDNLDYGNKNLKKDFVGISFRFLWEPEFRLSLGAETGTYAMFSKQSSATSNISGETKRSAIPLLLLVRMRVIDHFYLGTGFGLALLSNTTLIAEQKIVAKTTSLSNYQFTSSYLYPIDNHVQIGLEAKLFDFGAYNDWMYCIQLFCAYRF